MKLILLVVLSLFIIITMPVTHAESIPDWVKNTAGWWAADAISETEFVNAIEFLVNNGIIDVSGNSNSESDGEVPDWVKNTAGWWATDAISEAEFITSIEFLIESGLISLTNFSCNSDEDKNKNKIPDELENIPIIRDSEIPKKVLFNNKDWSNCIFPMDLSHYSFNNVNFSNSDFSNSDLLGTQFNSSTFENTDFSNSILHGVSFFDSDFINVNFDNTDFAVNTWEQPFIIYTYSYDSDFTELKVDYSCPFVPCHVHTGTANIMNNEMLEYTFGKNSFPLNLKFIESIDDMSEQRTIWRLISDFTSSRIENSSFYNSNLSEVRFLGNKMSNLDFSNSNMYNTQILRSELFNVKTQEKIHDNVSNSRMLFDEERVINPKHIDLNVENFSNSENLDLEIKFKTALDEIPINWSMGLDIFQETLYVADTDNHRIIEYDVNTFEKLSSFSSPFQNFCTGVNAFTSEKEDCPPNLRNLPTSTVILDNKLYVAYGFQNEIQVFDMIEKKFLFRFGDIGSNEGEFNGPFNISASSNQLFVVDSKNNRIQIFGSDGNFINQFTTNVNSFSNPTPYDLKIYQNRIFILDKNDSSIQIFGSDGKFIKKFFINEKNSNSSFVGIDVNKDLILIIDSGNDLILIFDLDGNLLMKFGNNGNLYGQFISPYDIVYDGKHIFISDTYNYRIQIFELFS